MFQLRSASVQLRTGPNSNFKLRTRFLPSYSIPRCPSQISSSCNFTPTHIPFYSINPRVQTKLANQNAGLICWANSIKYTEQARKEFFPFQIFGKSLRIFCNSINEALISISKEFLLCSIIGTTLVLKSTTQFKIGRAISKFQNHSVNIFPIIP